VSAPGSNVLTFPPARSARLLSTVTLHTLNGEPIASADFLPGDPGAAWSWIVETVSAKVCCTADEVRVGDCDIIEVDGVPVCCVEIVRPLHLR
jgi:hypothetical protein